MLLSEAQPKKGGDSVKTVIGTVADLSLSLDISVDEAKHLKHLMNIRQENRVDGEMDAVVVVDDWLLDRWEEDYDYEAETSLLLAKTVEEYSEKSYRITGAAHVDAAAFDGGNITESLTSVDHADEDYGNELGESYIPKSGLRAVLVWGDDHGL